MDHSLALILIGLALGQWKDQGKLLSYAGYSLFAGIILFSGSLYIIVFAKIKMGYVTPLGGILFIMGWFFLALAAWKRKHNK